ncbi:PREDICTED: uncharacterized protein LOC105966912 [Erythranthe guttata]|uniref:uncharacterized protein LOC105966912 n=1 Tax=Erythranthe guttata TaxID=4155 RepID=UPI00064E049A|nr:PREDICTED: uncharacterized protein LOC105966912 [Erythranthe guttata]|eukprot:XP_012846942.1 PREDICTED: uncharacterized protein LOC105966912 [Erythranthe guttata]
MASFPSIVRDLTSQMEAEATPAPQEHQPAVGEASTAAEETPQAANNTGGSPLVAMTMENLQALLASAVQEGSVRTLKEPEAASPKRRMGENGGRGSEGPVRASSSLSALSPFSADILDDDLPHSFRPVTYEYLGTTDPCEHLCRFNNTSDLHRFTEGVKCRVFATTLAGAAQAWFSQLPAGTIGSFDQLSACFMDHFASSKKQKRSTLTLFAVRQREGEYLRSFIKRFISATLEPPASFNALLKKAERYMNAKEAVHNKFGENKGGLDAKREKKEERMQKSTQLARREVQNERKIGPRFDSYAPLVAQPGEILLAIENNPKLKWPRTYAEAPRKSPTLGSFCRFHNDYGHTTNECQHLRDEIERLIRTKNLPEFVKEGNQRPQQFPARRANEPRKPEPGREKLNERKDQVAPANFISMILGGPSGGDSNRARRAHLRQLRETEELFGEIEEADRASRAHLRCLCEMEAQLEEVQRISYVPPIVFGPQDKEGIRQPHSDALVITAMVANFDIARILVDTGSSADVIYYDCFRKMNMDFELKYVETSLVGFSGESVRSVGEVCLPISLGMEPVRATRSVKFLVLDAPSTYNIILGRPSMNSFQAVVSTYHMKLKFPVLDQIGEVRGDQETSRRCYYDALRRIGNIDAIRTVSPGSQGKEDRMPEVDPAKEEAHVKPMEELMVVQLCKKDASRTTRIGGGLDTDMSRQLVEFLRQNQDVFAFTPADLGSIDEQLVVHRLNVKQNAKPVKQKRRHFGAEKDKIIQEEVRKLLAAGQIREIRFPTWLSNAVLVKKGEGKWRMCIDFRDLNKACPKDYYPLPRIDQLVDSTAGCEMLSMMDASHGYHQIPLCLSDQPKVSFITSTGTYCYTVMPFRLKNAGATYQRLVDKMFKDQLGRNMEIYVDDMLVKSQKASNHLEDLKETFCTLRRYGMKLNPNKCAFGVKTGKFLGYMVTERGVEVNPEKVQAVLDMEAPRNIKEVQMLAGRITALSRFISKAGEASHPFFKILRKGTQFEWTEESGKAFEQLKSLLAPLPLLAKPVPGEKLYVYLAVGEFAVSSVLAREEEGVQSPVYYASKLLRGAEMRYSEIEKMGLALVTTARKLRPYFLSHAIVVRTNHPMKTVMGRMEVSGRMVKWAVEMGQFDISYEPRIAIKGQALADFLQETTRPEEQGVWKVFVDGSANASGSGVGVFLAEAGEELEYAIRLPFKASNNEAEYEAVIHGMKLVSSAGGRRLNIFLDSQLVVQQVKGEFEIKNERMMAYCEMVRSMMSEFDFCELAQIPREENQHADFLAKVGSMAVGYESRKIQLLVGEPCSGGEERVATVTRGGDWRTEIRACLQGKVLGSGRAQKVLEQRASNFCLIGDILHKRGYTRPHLRCLSLDEGRYVLSEIHQGCCGDHAGARALVSRVVRAGYFWPTLRKDAGEFVKRCDKCQRHGPLIHTPGEDMTIITSPCPFAQWGIDIVGPMPLAKGQRKFLIVAVDYFSKWVEAVAVARITDTEVMKFIWQNICCRYGLPRDLISDNGTQFNSAKIQGWCAGLGIKQRFAAVAHPQANGQVEVTNRVLLEGIKKRLEAAKGNWVEELHAVLWGYRTSPKEATGESPFSLVYGTEAVIPVEVGMPSSRIMNFQEIANSVRLREELDLVMEKQQSARERMEISKTRIKAAYDKRVRQRVFQVGDLVLKQADALKMVGKLMEKWEGPYKVVAVLAGGAYMLEDMNGLRISRAWNVCHLKRYYI